MGKRIPELDWHILEEYAAWPPAEVLAAGKSSTLRLPRRWPRWVFGVALMLFLILLVMGYREVRRADQTMARVEGEVRAVAAADVWIKESARQTINTNVALAHPTPDITPKPRQEVHSVEVRGHLAMVEVWTTASAISWLPAPYRQTRFYQETEQGWLPTDPPDVFWQPLISLQAGRFTFIYGPRDADAVLNAATHVESLDADLRAELGLPATQEALTVKVVAEPLPSLDPVDLAYLYDGATLYVVSPALLPLPAQFSEGDALNQLVAGLLAMRNLDEALMGPLSQCDWGTLADGVRLWLLREHSELPSSVSSVDNRQPAHQPRHDEPPSLDWLGPNPNACSATPASRESRDSKQNYSMPAAFVNYTVLAYGRDRLPALLDGMQRYDSWETLFPAVYGVSAADFEAGWQNYLRITHQVATPE